MEETRPVAAALDPAAEMLIAGVNVVFECLGRALVCLDREFRVVHTSGALDRLLGDDGAAGRALGKPAEEVFGSELFGPRGRLRRALEEGERREGWGATVNLPPAAPRLVSITGAPLDRELPEACDPRVAYLVVLRPAEESLADAGGSAPTVFSGLVARSATMLAIFRLIENLGESEATVLLTGESGTGKELVARALHLHSPRRHGPFVAVNCGALPGELLESELFGHVRGAFTGAVRDRVGRFELASQGTLFLDEVAEVPPHLQVKLLRVLQERTFERVGESTSRRTEARVVAATNADVKRAIAEGTFRDDLYYRLRVVPIEVPPLRRRREDVEPLARFLLGRVAARYGRSVILAPDALRAMLGYDWPGNVRELENALEYAVAVCRGQTFHAQDLPPEVQGGRSSEPYPSPAPPGAGSPAGAPGAPASPDEPERQRLLAALETHRWRREETARALGLSRTTLWRKMRELGLLR
jgi:two-component system, NtrC family, response regulator AtoC